MVHWLNLLTGIGIGSDLVVAIVLILAIVGGLA